MKLFKAVPFLLLFIGILIADIPHTEDACIACHKILEEDLEDNDRILQNIFQDVHLQVGLSCADCHGGDPDAYDDEDAAMWDNPSYIGIIEHSQQPNVCGKCHSDPLFMRQYSASVKTDQVMQYWTSSHGKNLKRGIEKVATCTDCHGIHGIYSVKDPRSPVYPLNVPSTCAKCHNDADYMAEFNLPTNQYYKYRPSVHGKALLEDHNLSAPACNDCHGNHGALPPDVMHISDICGTCHVNNNTLFQNSHLGDIFVKRGFGQCEACHGNHGIKHPTDEYLNWEHGAVCTQCHMDKGNPKELADLFYGTIDSLKNQITLAEDLMSQAEQKGMEISDLFFPLEEAHQVLIKTRTSIHSFNKDYLLEVASNGFTSSEEAIQGAKLALIEFDLRRKWLFILSLIITFFAVTMYFKIKDIDSRNRNR